jgi:hypothetical protein
MGRAAQQRDMAQRRAEAARQAAGLSTSTSGLSVALKAMQESAARDLASAEAAGAKAKLLQQTRPEKDDPNIAAAMATASGASPTPARLSDRLAALRQLQPPGGPRRRACRRRDSNSQPRTPSGRGLRAPETRVGDALERFPISRHRGRHSRNG